MSNTIWKAFTFNELTTHELYTILQLRQKVFIVEQNCFYLDCDEKDFGCMHLCGYQNEAMVAYLRIAPQGVIYKEVSIGRVLTEKSIRATGLGKELMKKALEICDEKFKNAPIKIMAQSYLIKFYESFGFEIKGDEFIEDNIPHIYMFRK